MNTQTIKTQAKMIQDIKVAVINDNKSLFLCLNRLMNKQTESERVNFATTEKNGVGFNGVDAKSMTLYADLIQEGLELSDKQVDDCKRRIIKYIPQLVRGV